MEYLLIIYWKIFQKIISEVWPKLRASFFWMYKSAFFQNTCSIILRDKKLPSEVLCKKSVLKNFANFTRKDVCWSLLLIKLRDWGLQRYYKETPTQLLCCEICKIFKNTYFEDRLLTAALETFKVSAKQWNL